MGRERGGKRDREREKEREIGRESNKAPKSIVQLKMEENSHRSKIRYRYGRDKMWWKNHWGKIKCAICIQNTKFNICI